MNQIINDKDLMCASRIIQSALFENGTGILYGCESCIYSEQCFNQLKENGEMYIDSLREKLQEITGVNLDYHYNPDNPEAKFK